mmetsp:Transcript_4030/g.8441  ORF Transcript_4030/g.8441 Transcript_4030/m.8441 type:complete len:96 (-) Transcript_4030:409-696(-)
MIFNFLSVRTPSSFEEGSGSDGGKGRITERFLSPLPLINTVHQRELHFLRKLHPVSSLQITWRHNSRPDNLDSSRSGSVPSSHLVVKLGHSAREL